ncbi:MAG: ATP-binding cassette domain-containing protein [Lachnospiraceae bacterium]|nr:ATP-binding cassette domain-containing protein [Lachnospiraceae bacterium]
MINVDSLSKKFIRDLSKDKRKKHGATKEEFYAVDHVSFHANPGEILGILGANGAGKTTLLRMLGQLMTPDEGSVTVTDSDGTVLTTPLECKKAIGYLSGNTRLYRRLTTREMLMMFGDFYGISKEETAKRAEEIIALLDMESFADNRIERLSTGQTQRANIARCLVHHPDIYIFDEPTLGLDIISSEAIVSFMKKERDRGKTVLYSTHYMEEAQYLCDRIVMIHKGRIIATGTPAELMEASETDNLRDTFRAIIAKEGLENE